MHLRLTRK